jgi:hypothetical protein
MKNSCGTEGRRPGYTFSKMPERISETKPNTSAAKAVVVDIVDGTTEAVPFQKRVPR